jgi:hypothetical protein
LVAALRAPLYFGVTSRDTDWLADAEWSQWSDSEIARRCAVGHDMVARLRPSLALNAGEDSGERTYTTKRGTWIVKELTA